MFLIFLDIVFCSKEIAWGCASVRGISRDYPFQVFWSHELQDYWNYRFYSPKKCSICITQIAQVIPLPRSSSLSQHRGTYTPRTQSRCLKNGMSCWNTPQMNSKISSAMWDAQWTRLWGFLSYSWRTMRR